MEVLVYIGVGVFILGGIGTLIAAFQTSILWGVGCFLLYPVALIFLIFYWPQAKNPFFLQLAGCAVIFIASTLGADL
ncbi:hypothetical protein [Neptunomonas antarctica]|uniref:Uncharacterized protein n=1 Tax=Neptunomonas antarctica TaxID=619304 RepID=A0A1N7MW05_9GAMM|nr:hypothetical protein [Neptunomonas antarctica]SIS90260.1 hypothetical protein SAMN05421760_10762 [Neptunomonas antarctica]